MRVRGETAVRLVKHYGLPIHKEADKKEGSRNNIPFENAQRTLCHGAPKTIFVEAETELIDFVNDKNPAKRCALTL